jgi:hypothetical protein
MRQLLKKHVTVFRPIKLSEFKVRGAFSLYLTTNNQNTQTQNRHPERNHKNQVLRSLHMSKAYVHLNRVNELPENYGHICIVPEPSRSDVNCISITADPEGLRYLAEALKWLADFDQDKNTDPAGSREHLHLEPGEELDLCSCCVELCRADAKGTGEFPDFMKAT